MPTSSYVESSFWCFDALFVPQQHPARDLQDTFYLSGQILYCKPELASSLHPLQTLPFRWILQKDITMMSRRSTNMASTVHWATEPHGMRMNPASCYSARILPLRRRGSCERSHSSLVDSSLRSSSVLIGCSEMRLLMRLILLSSTRWKVSWLTVILLWETSSV